MLPSRVSQSYFNEIASSMLHAFHLGIFPKRHQTGSFYGLIIFLLKHTQFMKIHCSQERKCGLFEFKCLS